MCWLLLSPTATATNRNFSSFAVFGDSLSDTGNAFNRTGRPPQPYANGRFANGPIWIDRLSAEFKLTLTPITAISSGNTLPSINFAFGGATTGAGGNSNQLSGVQQQVDLFASRLGRQQADADALYFVWAGANDYLGGRTLDADEPIANLTAAITTLIEQGARHLVVANLPSLGQLPATRNRENAAVLNRLTHQHNQQLAAAIAALNQRQGVEVLLLDVNALFDRAVAGEFGFTNVTEPCLNPQTGRVCPNPDRYLFWDGIHPTAAAHQRISAAALSLLSPGESSPQPQGQLPQPIVFVGILLVSGLGVAALAAQNKSTARRRH